MNEQELRPNEKHKSSVFALLFSKPDVLRELYSAIEGVELPPDIPISINTLSNALIKGKINDISFLIDNRLVVILEHQSTISRNMPLRILKYIDKIYDAYFDYEKIYLEKLVEIPKPEFIVLYNGEKPYPEKNELRLSSAFMDIKGLTENNKTTLELVVQVYNINHGQNQEIQKRCETLNNYSYFINKIREFQKTKLTLANSIEHAIKYCIGNNILKDFLKEHGSEVCNLLFHEYDFDTHLRVRYKEGHEEGLHEGREERNEEIAQKMKDKGYSTEDILEMTGVLTGN
jgi:hypothetical protein